MKNIINLTLLILISISSYSKKKDHELSLNLIKGETYYHHSFTENLMENEFQGEKIEMKMTTKSKMGFKVIEKHESWYDLLVKMENFSISMESPDGTIEFYSEGVDSSDVISMVISRIIEKYEFTMQMNFDGTIKGITSKDVTLKEIIDGFTDISPALRQQIEGLLKQALEEEAFTTNIELITAVLPGKPVSVKSTWENQLNQKSMIPMLITNKFSLMEYNKDYAVIECNSIIEPIEKDTTIQANGMPAKFNLAGTMLTTLKVDSKTGWIITSDMKQEIGGDIEVLDSDYVPGGMKVPLNITNTIRITGSD